MELEACSALDAGAHDGRADAMFTAPALEVEARLTGIGRPVPRFRAIAAEATGEQ